LRSSILLRQINIDAWMEQEEGGDDQLTRLSEMTLSSTLYVTRRLRLLSRFAQEPELMRWAGIVRSLRPQQPGLPLGIPAPAVPAPTAPAVAKQDALRLVCPKCRTGMRVPYAALQGRDVLNVRCPQCRNVVALRKKPAAAAPSAPVAANLMNTPKGA
jgi:predicted Zn finger-like uncharacterized protein